MTGGLRVGLGVLALVMLVVGAWNQYWPEHFFATFPGVDDLPPFSEHYARDFGGAAIGLGIVSACAAAVPRTVLVIPALLAVAAWSIPHAVFHFANVHGDATVFTVVATGSAALAPPVLLVVAVLRMRRDRRALHDPALG